MGDRVVSESENSRRCRYRANVFVDAVSNSKVKARLAAVWTGWIMEAIFYSDLDGDRFFILSAVPGCQVDFHLSVSPRIVLVANVWAYGTRRII